MLIPLGLKRLLINFYISKQYDVKFGKKAGADLSTFFEGKNFVNNNSSVSHSHIGLGTYIAGNTSLSRIKIGRFCSIGQNVKNRFALHPTNFVSTHPAFFSINKQAGFTFVNENHFEEHKYIDKDKELSLIIGNDVWIGNNVVLMDGITIGDGAIIGTGAVVTKDVEPYCIVGGIPAKKIRKRFDENTIKLFLEQKWWNRDFDWIKRNSDSFRNTNEFIDCLKKDIS